MATVPGGLFDSSTNTNVDASQGALISSFLDSLGLSEGSLTRITVSADPDDFVVRNTTQFQVVGGVDLDPGETLSLNTGNDPGLNMSGTGQADLALNLGGGSQNALFTTGIPILQALTIDPGSLGSAAGGVDSLTGGGPALSDAQRNYYYAMAQKFGASGVKLAEIDAALKILSDNGDTPPTDLLTYYLRLGASPNNTLTELKLDGGNAPQDVMLAMRLADLPGVTLAFSNMDKLLLIGQGAARIDDTDGAMIIGDGSRQVFAGGSGNDTLVGGGGQDTLVGGAGADVFGMIKRGHVQINDFTVGTDKLAFDFAGVTSKADLSTYLTGVTNSGGNTIFHFGSDASITLVGVSATGLFDDMLFNIT
jgi:hypothetical protein